MVLTVLRLTFVVVKFFTIECWITFTTFRVLQMVHFCCYVGQIFTSHCLLKYGNGWLVQGFKYSKMQRFRDSWNQRFTDLKLFWFKDWEIRVQWFRFKNSKIQWFFRIQTFKFKDSRILAMFIWCQAILNVLLRVAIFRTQFCCAFLNIFTYQNNFLIDPLLL